MTTESTARPTDLTGCDTEPIHIPGSVQAHGVMLSISPSDLTFLQVSDNTETQVGVVPESLLGQPLERLFGEETGQRLRRDLVGGDLARLNPTPVSIRVDDTVRRFDAVAHQSGGMFILELEPASADQETPDDFFLAYHRHLKEGVTRLQAAPDVTSLCRAAAEGVRRMTGFDRVLAYRFDDDWNGWVVAEDNAPDEESFLGLHFPASDIPSQARALYRRNWLRFVVDAAGPQAAIVPPLNPLNGRPLDLSFSVLRSVSPIHREYLRNMGVLASLSLSIIVDGELWGLIACHHREPRLVSYEARAACEFLAQMLSSQIAARQAADEARRTTHLRTVRAELVSALEESGNVQGEHFLDGLIRREERLLEIGGATGAAVCFEGWVRLIGETPSHDQVTRLIEWLADHGVDEGTGNGAFSTRRLSLLFSEAEAYSDRASGLLAVAIARSPGDCLLWFRPEEVRTVDWAGDPHKPVSAEGSRLHPRQSFALWQETVRGTSLAWHEAEKEAARELGHAVTTAALHRSSREMQRLNRELAQRNQELDAFASVASHDLRAPLRGIDNLAGWIQEDAGDALGGEAGDMLEKLRGRVRRMEGIVEGVLQYARAGRAAGVPEPVDVAKLLSDITDLLAPRPGLQVEIGDGMPTLMAERLPLQQVFQNLIGNALKHNTRAIGHVWIRAHPDGTIWQFSVDDDGPGIAPEHQSRVFEPFQTLTPRDVTENTGIGLALVRKIVEAQGGRVWVESEPGSGASFRFTWLSAPASSD